MCSTVEKYQDHKWEQWCCIIITCYTLVQQMNTYEFTSRLKLLYYEREMRTMSKVKNFVDIDNPFFYWKY